MARRSVLIAMKAMACLLLVPAPPAAAQKLGPSLEVYPSGVIVTARYSIDASDSTRIHLHAGANATDRRDWGEHAEERGAGFGFGVAGHKYLRPERLGPWFGIRADLWFLVIDWLDPGRAGETEVTVLQPTARAGWTFSTGRIDMDLSAGLGAEVNVQTKGESVGQGAIFLVGFAIGY